MAKTTLLPKDRIILPLDVPSVAEAKKLVDLLAPHVGLFKIGLEFIWSTIADLLLLDEKAAIELLKDVRTMAKVMGAEKSFIDAKLCDIPNTVKGASIAISRMGVKMFNVHASCGEAAVQAVVEARNEARPNIGDCLVFGVTVLTSIDEEECQSIFGGQPEDKVLQFADMLLEAGANGIICSPHELKMLWFSGDFDDLLFATPGVRPSWAAKGDQKRVMTPAEAIKAGADYLVIGRPITKPPVEIGGPVEAAKLVADEIASALN